MCVRAHPPSSTRLRDSQSPSSLLISSPRTQAQLLRKTGESGNSHETYVRGKEWSGSPILSHSRTEAWVWPWPDDTQEEKGRLGTQWAREALTHTLQGGSPEVNGRKGAGQREEWGWAAIGVRPPTYFSPPPPSRSPPPPSCHSLPFLFSHHLTPSLSLLASGFPKNTWL